MKRRRIDARDERRKGRVEINLLGEEDSRPVRRRGGCSLPFTGVLLALLAIELGRAVLG